MSPSPRRPDFARGRARFTSSGQFTPTLIAVFCAVLVAVSWERGRGNFHRLTSAMLPPSASSTAPTGPGGEEILHLQRTPDAIASQPEFTGATLLPGRGLNVLQITAQIPGHGEVPLLMSPPIDKASEMLSGTGPDANGSLSATMGGAFLIPWAGRLTGKPSETGGGLLQTLWLGQRLTFPAVAPNSGLSTMGLLLNRPADNWHTDVTLDGQSVDAVYHPGTFSGNWPSTGAVQIHVDISGHTMDLSVAVQNTGASPMPVGIGWLPYFSIASHDRAHASLVIPSTTRLETSRGNGLPTGRTVSVAGSSLDFQRARGTALGDTGIDDTFVHLTEPILSSNGPVAELRDTAWGYGIRVMPLTANIKALHVVAPPDKPWVAIGPDTNFDDALGPEWNTAEGSGITTLQPGDSLQWRVRVEVFTFSAGSSNPAT